MFSTDIPIKSGILLIPWPSEICHEYAEKLFKRIRTRSGLIAPAMYTDFERWNSMHDSSSIFANGLELAGYVDGNILAFVDNDQDPIPMRFFANVRKSKGCEQIHSYALSDIPVKAPWIAVIPRQACNSNLVSSIGNGVVYAIVPPSKLDYEKCSDTEKGFLRWMHAMAKSTAVMPIKCNDFPEEAEETIRLVQQLDSSRKLPIL